MRITPITTTKITAKNTSITNIIDQYVRMFHEGSILAVTSKIVSLCEGRVMPLTTDKEKLLLQEATYYLPKRYRRYGSSGVTVTHHAFIGAAGIDESNADGCFVLLPQDAQATAQLIRQHLKKKFKVQQCGVIITDSHSTPMRRGASGVVLAYSGFKGLHDYRGKPDIFGRTFRMEQANIADALAAAAVLAMGEGAEQTPLALISDLPNITFNNNAPSPKERKEFFVNIDDDIFLPIFNLKRLKKGRRNED